jgi:hypothetical protein
LAAGLLRWEDIGRVSIQTMGTQRMLAIAPRDPAAVMARANVGRRLVMRMNAGIGFPAVNIPEVALPYSLESLIDEMRRHNPALAVSGATRWCR